MVAPEQQLTDAQLLALPKVDLHVHLVGAASPHTVADLARRHPDADVPASLDALRRFYAFRDFAHFLEVYGTVSSLVRTPDDITALVVGLGDDLAAQGVAYAEVTVTPHSHASAGIPPADLARALDDGASDVLAHHGIPLAWVYDTSAGEGLAAAEATLRAALDHPPERLVGFGLGGAEAGVRRADFAAVFTGARRAGLASVPHAGETTGPEEVWSAVRDLGAVRVGHGIAASGDPQLLDRLRERGTVLEVCLSSNVATGTVGSLEQHPLPVLLGAGVAVVLGSDDPPMFATSLLREYRLARDVLGVGSEQLLGIVRAGIDASFAAEPLKARLRDALEASLLPLE